MKENNTFVQFYRKIANWEWYTDLATFKLFFHCIIRANYKETNYRGMVLKRGQFRTGRKQLSIETGLSEMQIRTALKHLKLTNEITINSTSQYSIITVNNYDLYQSKNYTTNQQLTNEQPTTNQQLTTDNKYNKDNNLINNSNTSYINISSSSSSIEDLPKISEEEEELLKNHSLKNKVKYFKPWLRKVLANGDYKEILEKEKKRLQAKEEKKKQEEQKQILKQVQNDENDEKEIEQIQKRIRENFKKRRTN